MSLWLILIVIFISFQQLDLDFLPFMVRGADDMALFKFTKAILNEKQY